jgi:hypothetical protein
MSLLSDPDSQVRAACAEAVGQFGAMDPASKERARTQLTRAMGDAEPLVRQESVRALERLLAAGILSLSDVPHLLSPLLLRAEDENVSVRKISMRFLGRLSDQTLPKDVRDRVLLALLGRLSDPARDVRAEAVRSCDWADLRTKPHCRFFERRSKRETTTCARRLCAVWRCL